MTKKEVAILAAVSLLVAVAYFGIWNFSIVYDDYHVFANQYNRSLLPLSKFFTEPGIYLNNLANPQNWRPLGAMARAATVVLFGNTFSYHHLLNLLLHLTNVWLIYFLIRALTKRVWLPASIAALIGVHPILTEAVTWISSMTALLWAALFFITCLLILHKKWSVLSCLTFAATLLIKESALPGVLVVLGILWFRENGDRKRWSNLLLEWLPYLSIAIVYFIAWILIAPNIPNLQWSSRLITPYIIWKYLSVIFWPANLFIFDSQSANVPIPKSFFDIKIIIAILASAVLVALAVVALRKQWRVEFIGLLWFLAFMSPFIQIVNSGAMIGTRALYVPLVGFFLAFLALGDRLSNYLLPQNYQRRSKIILTSIFIGLLLIMARASFLRNRDWQNGETFWNSVIRVDPKNITARVDLAQYYLDEGQDPQKALEVSQELLKVYPKHFGGWLNLANSYAALGEIDRADKEYRNLLRDYPGNGRVQRRLNYFYNSLGANYGIEINVIGNGGVYFEIHSAADPGRILYWAEEAEKNFKIFLLPGDYYIKFRGENTEKFTVGNDRWVPIAIKL